MKIYKSISCLLLFLSSCVCSQTVANGWAIENIHGPSQVGIVDTIPVDLNKDGLMDVVSASIEDGHLRAYINQGSLEFEQQYISTDVLGAFRVSATDFNNDGEVDFLIPSIDTQEIIAFIFDEKTTPFGYRKQIIADGVLLPTDAQAGDFNNDGLMDVVSLSFEENVVLLHTQDINGDFNTSIISKSPMRPRKIVVDDFNNDEILDFLVASEEDGSVRLFSGLGGLLFDENLISDQLLGIRFIARCDQNDAAYPDFVAGVTGLDQAVLFRNLENNTFNTEVIDSNLPGASAVHCADTNDDQAVELIGLSSSSGIIYQYELQGGTNKTLIANARDGYVNVSFADFEPNTHPKILTQAFFEDRNLLLSPQTSNDEVVVWEDFPDGAFHLESGDINNDGLIDVVYASFNNDKVYWAEQQVNGSYITHVLQREVDGAQSVTLIDIDKDNDLDVITASAWGDQFWLNLNDGNGSFSEVLLTNTANNASRVIAADIDKDNKVDIVGTSALDDTVRVFVGSKDNQFSEEIISSSMNGAFAIAKGDSNNDKLIDLLVANFFGNNVILFINQGNFKFREIQIIDQITKPNSVEICDLDNNQQNELLISSTVENSLWLALKNGSDQYENVLLSNTLFGIRDIKCEDVDQNGWLDVIVTTTDDKRISVLFHYENNFTQETVSSDVSYRSIDFVYKNGRTEFFAASTANNSIVKIFKRDTIFLDGFED